MGGWLLSSEDDNQLAHQLTFSGDRLISGAFNPAVLALP